MTQAICLALLFGLALLTYASVSRFASRSVGCAAVALLFSVPHLTERSAALYADVPLGYLFLAANAGMACAFTRRPGVRPPLWLVGFMVALLAWMKQEGAILAAVIAIAAAMTFMFRIRWAGLARLAAGAVVPIVALVLFKSGWSGENKLTQGLAGSSSGSSDAWGVLFDYLVDGERWRITWEHLWKEVATEGTWSAYQEVGTNNQPALKWASLWPALAVTLLLLASWKRLFSNRAIAYAGLSAVGALTAYFLLYVIIPIRQVWHLETSLTRLLLQVLPSLVFFVFALVPLDAVSRDVAFRGRRDDEDGDP